MKIILPKHKQKLLAPLIATLIALLSFLTGIQFERYNLISNQDIKYPETAIVARVIDGDTVELDTGQIVRYNGITAPEEGDPFAEESTEINQELVENKKVRLEYEQRYKEDKFDRVLAYLFVDPKLVDHLSEPNEEGEINVSIELARQGLADVVIYQKRAKLIYQDELLEAEKLAQEEELGIWNK